jgi:hypothetical protein
MNGIGPPGSMEGLPHEKLQIGRVLIDLRIISPFESDHRFVVVGTGLAYRSGIIKVQPFDGAQS